MECGIIQLDEILQICKSITFHHVRIKTNSVADRLANEGVCCNLALIHSNFNYLNSEASVKDCKHISSEDIPTPDAGDMRDLHMGNLVPIPRGYDAGNMVDANIGDLNVNGGELLANLVSSWIVTSSLGCNIG